MLSSGLPDNEHLPKMRLCGNMALEAVLIATLLLADLAPPPEFLEAFGLHGISQILSGMQKSRSALSGTPLFTSSTTHGVPTAARGMLCFVETRGDEFGTGRVV